MAPRVRASYWDTDTLLPKDTKSQKVYWIDLGRRGSSIVLLRSQASAV